MFSFSSSAIALSRGPRDDDQGTSSRTPSIGGVVDFIEGVTGSEVANPVGSQPLPGETMEAFRARERARTEPGRESRPGHNSSSSDAQNRENFNREAEFSSRESGVSKPTQ